MQRTGKFQQFQHRGFKTRSELRVWKHLLAIWGGGILAWPALTFMFFLAVEAPRPQALLAAVLVLVTNVFVGWAPALLVFLLNWGIRGWIETGQQFRAARDMARHEREQQYAPARPAPLPQVPGEDIAAEWRRINAYGCCLDNVDAQGYPTHGAADCQHPDVRRAA